MRLHHGKSVKLITAAAAQVMLSQTIREMNMDVNERFIGKRVIQEKMSFSGTGFIRGKVDTIHSAVFSITGVTEEKLQEICRRFGDNKDPGLDGIPNKPLKLICESCMVEGFPPSGSAVACVTEAPKTT